MNRLNSPETNEVEPRTTTGLIRLASKRLNDRCLEERRAMRFGEEPIFAVRAFNTKGKDAVEDLIALLDDDELAMFDPATTYIVSQGPWPEFTDAMLPGTVARISVQDYTDAYLERYPVTSILL